jgi:hypothetical protein
MQHPAAMQDRKFAERMHDAAAWIKQNRPDFDLEATHPVTLRSVEQR